MYTKKGQKTHLTSDKHIYSEPSLEEISALYISLRLPLYCHNESV